MKRYRPNDVEIASQAAQWLDSLRTGRARDREGFADWLLESRRHVRASLLTIAVEKALEEFDPQGRFDIEAMLKDASQNVVKLEELRPSSQLPGRLNVRRILRDRTRYWVVAAALAAIALSWPLWQRYSSEPTFSTGVGQQESIKLDDGSVVHLNTQSRIQIDFSDRRRGIRILSGEALFDVQHEPGRPFDVYVGDTVVRALGTEFDVDTHGSGIRVSVLDGRVQISSGTDAEHTLGAGQEAQILNRSIENTKVPDIKRRVAWRQRRLDFQEDPLDKVVAEFNRYNRAPKLRIEGSHLGKRTYTGIFNADDPDSLAQLLSEQGDLVVERKAEEIVIREREKR